MKKYGITAAIIGAILNLGLFFTKLYVGLSTNSLSIYCDSINNLGDTLACVIAIMGFWLALKMSDKKSKRTQSLATFVISIFIAVTGAYFVYNGLQRMMYPLKISYSANYAYIITATVFVKILMAVMYMMFNKKSPSPVLKALVLDSILDAMITVFALMGLFLVTRVKFAVDGAFAIIIGTMVVVSSAKNIISQGKYLIND